MPHPVSAPASLFLAYLRSPTCPQATATGQRSGMARCACGTSPPASERRPSPSTTWSWARPSSRPTILAQLQALTAPGSATSSTTRSATWLSSGPSVPRAAPASRSRAPLPGRRAFPLAPARHFFPRRRCGYPRSVSLVGLSELPRFTGSSLSSPHHPGCCCSNYLTSLINVYTLNACEEK